MRSHTEYETILAAYDGLSRAEREELDAHLAECAGCRTALAEYRQMDGELRSAAAPKASAGLRVRFHAALAEATTAPAQKPSPLRLAPGAPKVTVRRPAIATRSAIRFALPVAAVLLFVAAIFVTLQVERLGSVGSNTRPAAAVPPRQAEVVSLAFTCDQAAVAGKYGAWAKVIAAFEAENPDIQVEIKSLPLTAMDAESYRKSMADLAAKTDVFCAIPSVSDWQMGLVANLGPYIAQDPEFNPDDFYPNMWNPSDHGEVLSVPTYFTPMLISYNPELFDKGGVPHPQPGWSWDAFLADAKALTVRNGDKVTQWGYYGIGNVFGARLLSGLSADLRELPDYAAAGKILRWYEKLYWDEPAAPVEPVASLMGGGKFDTRPFDGMLSRGQVAMSEMDLRSDRTGPRHLAPYPDSPIGVLAGRLSDLVMSGRTAHRDEAYRLLSYLSRHLPDGEVPARRSLSEQASFWKGLDAPSAEAYRYTLDHLTLLSYAQVPTDYGAYEDAAIAVVKGKKTADQALADLDAAVHLRGGPTERAANTGNGARSTPMAQPAKENPAGAEGVPTTVVFNCEHLSSRDSFTDAVKAFQAENRDVQVLVKTEPIGLVGPLERAAENADVFCAYPTTADVAAGFVRNLAPYISVDPTFRPYDFYPGVLRDWNLPDVALSVPTYFQPALIAYDPEAFDEAGVPYPQPWWTWDEFANAAARLTKREGDKIVRWGFGELREDLILRRAQSEWQSRWRMGDMSDTGLTPFFEWYEKLYVTTGAARLSATRSQSAGNPSAGDEFINLRLHKQVAMWDKVDDSTPRGSLAAYPVGVPGEPQAPFDQLPGLVISGRSSYPDAAWRWISYLSQHLPDGEVPARRWQAERASFWQGLDTASELAYDYALDHVEALHGTWQPRYEVIKEQAVKIATGEQTADQVMAASGKWLPMPVGTPQASGQ